MGPRERALLTIAMVLSPAVLKVESQFPNLSLPIPHKALSPLPYSTYTFSNIQGQALTFTGPEGRGNLSFHDNSPFEGEYTLTLDPSVNFRTGVHLNIWSSTQNFDLSLLLQDHPDGGIMLRTGFGKATDPIYPVSKIFVVNPDERNTVNLTWGSSPDDKKGTISRFRKIIWNGHNLLSRLAVPNLPSINPRNFFS